MPNVLSMSLGSLSFGSCDKMCNARQKVVTLTRPVGPTCKHSFRRACLIAKRLSSVLTLSLRLGLRGTTITAASGDGASHFAFGPFSGGIGDDLNAIICNKMNMPVYPALYSLCALCRWYTVVIRRYLWTSVLIGEALRLDRRWCWIRLAARAAKLSEQRHICLLEDR